MSINNTQKIKDLCEKHWEQHKNNCSGFVKDVAQGLGILLTGQANDIVGQIQKRPWTILKSGLEAKHKAEQGMLVIGGLVAKPYGHVVIVVAGPAAHGKFPTAYWASFGGVSKRSSAINWLWKNRP